MKCIFNSKDDSHVCLIYLYLFTFSVNLHGPINWPICWPSSYVICTCKWEIVVNFLLIKLLNLVSFSIFYQFFVCSVVFFCFFFLIPFNCGNLVFQLRLFILYSYVAYLSKSREDIGQINKIMYMCNKSVIIWSTLVGLHV